MKEVTEKMADLGIDVNKLPTETRSKLAELELELSEGRFFYLHCVLFILSFLLSLYTFLHDNFYFIANYCQKIT